MKYRQEWNCCDWEKKFLPNSISAAGFQVQILEYCDENGDFYYNDWDEDRGFIYRSKRFDHRNHNGELGFISLIVDAIKA